MNQEKKKEKKRKKENSIFSPIPFINSFFSFFISFFPFENCSWEFLERVNWETAYNAKSLTIGNTQKKRLGIKETGNKRKEEYFCFTLVCCVLSL